GLEGFKKEFARDRAELASWKVADPGRISLEETIENAKPSILIGVSATPGTFTEAIVRKMAALNQRPLVFPISNPTSKAECTAEQAVTWSDGRAIVATGSPFAPVVHNGVTHRIGQCNNAFIFPGIGLGVCVSKARRVSDGMFLAAAQALATHVTEADIAESAVYPQVATIRDCSHSVACAVIRRAVAEGLAEPEILNGLEETVRRAMWFPEYLPIRYEPTGLPTRRHAHA
ncbi:MAG TPA: malic enzyme-like NAD(P)-binding protein, partial [Thermoanaerobaculia bacterium]|nr:malic enzyme-like NAD(P)-binding protein [Thermoanaerobaculia bacterium]